ncbi:MAG: hypothetical protein KJN62_09020 [Deltaproteobacteria bacterium]|nr:hypothetical protein [Deltaproteobacteria bacterium]
MELIIHCGDGKTGSSAIQTSLYNAREKLLKHHILYYADGPTGVHNYFVYLTDRRNRLPDYSKNRNIRKAHKIIRKIRRLSKKKNVKYVLLSSEFMFTFSKEHIDRIIDSFGIPFSRIHAIAYIRCPQSMYLSLMQQRIKASHTLREPSGWTRNEVGHLRKWRDYVGNENLYVNLFDKRSLHSGCVVQDFQETLSKIVKENISVLESVMVNESLSAEQMIILQEFRKDFLHDIDNTTHPRSNSLIAFFTKLNSKRVMNVTRPRLNQKTQNLLKPYISEMSTVLDAEFGNLKFSSYCKQNLAENETISSDTQPTVNASNILESWNDDIIQFLKSCIPLYNDRLKTEIDPEILNNALILDRKAFFLIMSDYLYRESCYATAFELEKIALANNDYKKAKMLYLFARNMKRRTVNTTRRIKKNIIQSELLMKIIKI